VKIIERMEVLGIFSEKWREGFSRGGKNLGKKLAFFLGLLD